MSATIPSFKHTTKEDLQKQIEQIKYEKDQLQEKLYDLGIDKRPTIMGQIEKIEKETIDTITYVVKECEKKTGRPLPVTWISKGMKFGSPGQIS